MIRYLRRVFSIRDIEPKLVYIEEKADHLRKHVIRMESKIDHIEKQINILLTHLESKK